MSKRPKCYEHRRLRDDLFRGMRNQSTHLMTGIKYDNLLEDIKEGLGIRRRSVYIVTKHPNENHNVIRVFTMGSGGGFIYHIIAHNKMSKIISLIMGTNQHDIIWSSEEALIMDLIRDL